MSRHTLVALFVFGGFAVISAVEHWMEPRRRALRRLARIPLRRIEELKDGESARVVGTVKDGAGPCTSPVTDRACIAYRFVIEERSGGKGRSWKIVAQETSCPPSLILVEGSSELFVEGPFLFALDFDDTGETSANLPPGVFRVLERAGASLTGLFGFRGPFRFREAILRPGDRVVASGLAAVDVSPSGTRDDPRAPPLRRSLRGTGRDLVVLADAPRA